MAIEPFTYVVDREQHLVTLTYSDPASAQRWRETMDRVLTELPAAGPYRFLGDRREVHKSPSLNYVEIILEYFSTHRDRLRGSRWAQLVDANDPLVYGTARMFELRSQPDIVETRVFTDFGAALAWLAS